MLVQGFIDLVGHVLTGANYDKITVMGGAKPSASDINTGIPTYEFSGSVSSTMTGQVQVRSYIKSIWLGTSDTPAKSTDCTIDKRENVETGTVSVSSNKVVVTGTYTNGTSETKIFKEIGLSTRGEDTRGNYISILLSRSVFPEPVVIPAGESKSFTITIDFNKFADTVVTA